MHKFFNKIAECTGTAYNAIKLTAYLCYYTKKLKSQHELCLNIRNRRISQAEIKDRLALTVDNNSPKWDKYINKFSNKLSFLIFLL